MAEFNADGSLKLPGYFQQKIEQDKNRMQRQRCIRVSRKIVNFNSPKKCVLAITLSDAITDSRFVSTIYQEFMHRSSVPTKLVQKSEREFEVEVGTDFKRCTDCNSLIRQLREFFDGNMIEDKGSCTFEQRQFAYEDYF